MAEGLSDCHSLQCSQPPLKSTVHKRRYQTSSQLAGDPTPLRVPGVITGSCSPEVTAKGHHCLDQAIFDFFRQ
jgi:hypothetical protein